MIIGGFLWTYPFKSFRFRTSVLEFFFFHIQLKAYFKTFHFYISIYQCTFLKSVLCVHTSSISRGTL